MHTDYILKNNTEGDFLVTKRPDILQWIFKKNVPSYHMVCYSSGENKYAILQNVCKVACYLIARSQVNTMGKHFNICQLSGLIFQTFIRQINIL